MDERTIGEGEKQGQKHFLDWADSWAGGPTNFQNVPLVSLAPQSGKMRLGQGKERKFFTSSLAFLPEFRNFRSVGIQRRASCSFWPKKHSKKSPKQVVVQGCHLSKGESVTLATSTRGFGAVAKSRQSSRRSEYRKAAETVPAATATYWPALGQGEKSPTYGMYSSLRSSVLE